MGIKLWFGISVFILALGAGIVWWVNREKESVVSSGAPTAQPRSEKSAENAAVKAGKVIARNQRCEGNEAGKLTRLPMDETDYSMIIPYGLMVGGHVTPIDHQYFSPAVFDSPRDAYPVYAMADSTIVDISERTNERGTEYRFVFMMSCTFFYYYDLVTSLAPEIKAVYESRKRDDIRIPLKAGDLVGRIGGQTLDFAVWDTTKPLKGFIVPEHYNAEVWKLYTADPLDYYTAEVKEKALAKYIRTVEPISGKIDYDIDGKLIGNWFLEGTEGYVGGGGNTGKKEYWGGHLSIAPDHVDPSAMIFSVGTWDGGEPKQFLIRTGAPDPATVGVETGAVKYDLVQADWQTADGKPWDRKVITKGPKAIPNANANNFGGCAVLQLMQTREVKVETFPNQRCAAVSDFSAQAKIYRR